MKIFYNFSAKTGLEEQQTFFALLYHDARNGQIIRFTKKGEETVQYSTFDMNQLAYTGTDCHTYVSVNTFRGSRRTANQLFNKTGMFVDLDCHSYSSEEELSKIKSRTIRVLEKAFTSGELSVPTMITSTGRGFGLFYVLKSSIANTNSARKSMQFFDRTYSKLLDRFKMILQTAGSGLLEVDAKVRDASRVARMPGTVNLNNGKMCHLISVNYTDNGMPRYYDLKELVSGCKLNRDTSKEKRGKILSFNAHINPFLGMRVKRMKMLQELRGEACVGECREVMSFITYSALTQINEHDKAVELLYQFNNDGVLTKTFNKEEGWVQAGSDWYYFHNGALVTSEVITVGGKTYLFDYDGKLACNKDVAGYYADKNGVIVRNKLITIDGHAHYYGADGRELRGVWKINGKIYYLDY